jgi:signal transduction histidine kinase
MEFYVYSGILNGVIALSIGVAVILGSRKERLNQVFFLLAMATAWWAFGYSVWLSAGTAESALFWIRIASIGSLFIPLFYFHWVLVLLHSTDKHRTMLALAYFGALILTVFSFSPQFIAGVGGKLFFPYWPEPGLLYTVYFFIAYIGLTLYSTFLLIREYNRSDSNKRGQIVYVICGSLCGFGGGATNFFLSYGVPIPPYTNFLVALYPIILGYATLRYHLFNIKIIATELLVFIIWIAVFVEFLLADTVNQRLLEGAILLFSVVFGILIIRSVMKEVQQKEELAKLSKELAAANEHLQELDKLKSDFVSIASHQLRSPLTAIKGYSSMVLEGSMGKVSKEAQGAVEKIFRSSERLTAFVNELLDISRIERGKMEYNFEEADFVAIARSVCEELKIVAGEKGLIMECHVAQLGEIKLKLDTNKIRQVVQNLLDNAIKYTLKGRIDVRLTRQGSNIELAVTDTGVGIAADDIDQLFEKFSRAKDSAKVNGTGTGLGLYVAREIARGHGGDVSVASAGKGRGSTFTLRLPVRRG